MQCLCIIIRYVTIRELNNENVSNLKDSTRFYVCTVFQMIKLCGGYKLTSQILQRHQYQHRIRQRDSQQLPVHHPYGQHRPLQQFRLP